jgi:hypothetical protein
MDLLKCDVKDLSADEWKSVVVDSVRGEVKRTARQAERECFRMELKSDKHVRGRGSYLCAIRRASNLQFRIIRLWDQQAIMVGPGEYIRRVKRTGHF